VGDLDEDNDGFWNLEEFKAKTDPRDPNSMPPYTDKLFFRRRISHDYILKLNPNSDGTTFQIQRLVPSKQSVFKTINEEFGFDKGGAVRFKILSSRKETAQTKFGVKDIYILRMLDLATKKEFDLKEGEEVNLADYEAEFEFRWKKRHVIANLKEGGTFQLPGLGKTYYILKLEENKAVIAPDEGGKPAKDTIEIKQG
jgi:hypothetical protein